MMDRRHKGRKVRLIHTSDPHTKLKTGALGVVDFYDSFDTLHVKWEDGSNLGLIPGCDAWEILPVDVAV